MKFSITHHSIYQPLSQVQGGVASKSPLPILNCVLIESDAKQLKFTTNNMEQQLASKNDLNEEPGKIPKFSLCIEAKKLHSLLGNLDATKSLELEILANTLILISGKSRYKLATQPADNFPTFDLSAKLYSLSVPARDLLRGLQKTSICMASNDVRYYLNGLCLMPAEESLSLLASDGHKLAMYCIPIQGIRPERDPIIPRQTALEVSKHLPNSFDEISIDIHATAAVFHLPQLTLATRLIEGRFPDINKIIPSKFEITATGDTSELLNSIRRVSVLSSEKGSPIGIGIYKNTLRLNLSNAENEDGFEEIDIEHHGEGSIYFNHKYLLDMINQIGAKKIQLKLNPQVSCQIEPHSNPPDCYQYILMPIKT